MDLSNKKLLMLGGGAYAKDVKAYKDEAGFLVYSVGKTEDPRMASLVDKHFYIERTDVNSIVKLVEEELIDGIFVGSSENYASIAIDVCERSRANFYATRKQWDILQNKAKFKEYARLSGFPVIPEYDLSYPPTIEEINQLQYPVMIKPTDSSGAKGVNACYNAEEFVELYQEAMKWSTKKEVIVETLIEDAVDFCVDYTIQNGNACLSYAYTKFKVSSPDHFVSIPMFHMFPSRYIDEYICCVDESAKRMIQNIGIQNGSLILQGFYKDGKFSFYEAGYRLGGGQVYILTDFNNGANSLKYIINQVLIGQMDEKDVTLVENAHFRFPCCNYYMALNPGVICEIKGLEEARNIEGVLNITKMRSVGDTILNTNALDRVAFRIHVAGKDNESLAGLLEKISRTIQVFDINGYEMQMEPLTYSHCIDLINQM